MAKRTKRQVKVYIKDLIEQVGWVTYPQLLRYLSSKNVDVDGEYNLEITDKNVTLWGNLSKVLVDSITDLIREESLAISPAPPQVYQLDQLSIHQQLITELPKEQLDSPAVFLTVLQNRKAKESDGVESSEETTN